MVSIHRPTGYGPVTLPLRHSAGYTYAYFIDAYFIDAYFIDAYHVI